MKELSMRGNNLSCPFPATQLAQFPQLERIDLSYNQILGK